MKKITKILLIILSFFILSITALAEEEETAIEDDTYQVHQVSYVDGQWNNLSMADNAYETATMGNSLGITYGGYGVASVFKYMLTSNTTGESILGFCMSPDRTIPTSVEFDSETSLVGRRQGMERMDAAYAAIIESGCHDKDCAFDEYVATSYALRAITYMFSGGQAIDGTKNAKAFTCAIYNEALSWIADDDVTKNTLKSMNPNYASLPSACSESDVLVANQNNGAAALERAKELFVAGLNAAFEVQDDANNHKGDVTIKLMPQTIDVSPENTTSTSSELKTYDVDIVFSILNIDAKLGKDGKLKNKINLKDVQCDSCAEYGITFDKIKDSSTGEIITENKNILELLTAKDGYFNGTINLTVSFTRSEDEECVPQIPFTINYTYSLPELKSNYAIGYETKSDDPGNPQDFLSVKKNSSEDTDIDMEDGKILFDGSITGIITCTEPDPEEEPPKCDEPTAFINPDCHKDGILEVYAPKNVKDCVLEKSDDTGKNSYELLGSKGGLKNQYCAVYCKEDYNTIYLQRALDDVKCGSGFELNTQIDGQKMCYTAGVGTAGKSGNDKYQINIQKFASDIESAQKRMIKAYREYMYNKIGYENIKSKTYDCCACSGGAATKTECKGWKVENGQFTSYKITEEYMYPDDQPKYKIKQIKITTQPDANTEEGACTVTPCSYTTTCVANPQTGKLQCYQICTASGQCDPPKVTLEQKQAAFKAARDKWLAEMENAYKDYLTYIKDIRDCSLAWSNDYDFMENVIVKYYYNEHQGEDEYYTPYYDIIRDNKNDDEIVLEVIDNPEQTYSQSEERFWYNDGVNGDGVDDYYKDGGVVGINNALRDYTFAICDDKGCKYDDQEISRAAFIRRLLNHVKAYQVPTQFYDIGSTYSKIVYSDFEITDPYEGIPLENELPTTFNACTGGEFDLLIENLGEYYDGDQYGRLIDCNATDNNGMFKCDPNTEIVVSAYQEAQGKDTFTGRYVCDYNTDCDCEGSEPECDMSYAGKYYLINQNCGSVEIECCDIYSSSYDYDKNNKYICSVNDTMYDTYSEAKKACTSTKLINGKYKCPDGTYSQFGGCYMAPVKLENDSSLKCSNPNYHIEKVLTSEICVADPIEDLSYCEDGYTNIGNNTCEKEFPIYSTDGLSDSQVGTIVGECTTVDGQKISYAEISKKYTCDAKVCDSSKGGMYKQWNSEKNRYDCIEMACCTDDICIHVEDGIESYYLKSKLQKVKNLDTECPTTTENEGCIAGNTRNYYYINSDNENVCVPACKYKGKYYDNTQTPYDVNLKLEEIPKGTNLDTFCDDGGKTECLEEYGGMYAFEVNGKITCPTIDCCYDGDGSYKPCWDKSRTIIYDYYSLTPVKECPSVDTECKTIYEGTYYYADRPADSTECFPIECCTDDYDAVCKVRGSSQVKLKKDIVKATNELTQCNSSSNDCVEEGYSGTWRYKGTKTCIEIKCCDTKTGLCEAVAGNKVNRSDIERVTDKETQCEVLDECNEDYGGRYAIPHCDDECLECVDIKCCTSNKGDGLCYASDGSKYNREGLTYIGEDGSCDSSCSDECDGDEEEDECPKCKIKCGPDGCTIVTTSDSECPLCDFKCFNCIFNNGEFNLTTKQISTTVMDEIAKNTSSANSESGNQAANRQYGYNWITTSHLSELNVPQELKDKMARITDKATETITEIGEQGETIYGGDKNDADSSALNFSIEMTPSITDYLRNYNREHINDGGYGNESMTCYHDMEDGEVRYKYIYCFSEVIDELTDRYGSKVTISDARVEDEASRKANANAKNYWQLWDEKVYDENAIGGPAWR